MERTLEKPKKQQQQKPKDEFIRSKQGVERYNMSRNTFNRIASEAGALYKIRGVNLVNVRIFEEYLETFRCPSDF